MPGKRPSRRGRPSLHLCKSQLPVIERALETAALMLRTDKSRGYCLEMICTDFLAGANLENDNPHALLFVQAAINLCIQETKGEARLRLVEVLP